MIEWISYPAERLLLDYLAHALPGEDGYDHHAG
jgi:hypothetical protein